MCVKLSSLYLQLLQTLKCNEKLESTDNVAEDTIPKRSLYQFELDRIPQVNILNLEYTITR